MQRLSVFPRTGWLLVGLAPVLLASLLWFCYQGAWTGPFIFDDTPNLSPMATYGQVDSRENLARWLDSGDSGPLGRPLSLLSFLIEDNTWPTDPGAYRRNNLWLHLLNGLLVGLLCHRLGRLAAAAHPSFGNEGQAVPVSPRRVGVVAGAAAVLWCSLPIHTATVLLVVQRMTLLFSLFVLLALLGWLRGRDHLLRGRTSRGLAWQYGSVLGLGGLGTLAKETAAVLPFLLLSLTLTLAPLVGPQRARRAGGALVGVGCLAVGAAVALRWPQDVRAYAARNFDVWDRLYTQPLVLMDYLRVGLLPRAVELFHDDFPVFDPRHPAWLPTLALATIVLAGVLAWRVRRQWPVLAFAILFFLAGHLLEAGPSPLELYFLHRNYLPILGPVWAIAWGLGTRPWPQARMALAGGSVYLGLCFFGVWLSAQGWRSEQTISLQWAERHPLSIRAASMAANYWGVRGSSERAVVYLDRFMAQNPRRALMHVGSYYMHCRMNHEDRARWDRLVAGIPTMEYDNTVAEALVILNSNIQEGRCRRVSTAEVLQAIDLFLASPAFQKADTQSDLYFKKAQILFGLNRPREALAAMDRAERIRPNEFLLREQGRLNAQFGFYPQALAKYREALGRDPRGRWQRWLGVSDAPRRNGIRRDLARVEAQARQSPLPASPGTPTTTTPPGATR